MSEQHIPSIDEDHMIETHFPGATKKVWRYYDENGWVFGYPNEIAINVLEHGLYVYMYQTKPVYIYNTANIRSLRKLMY